MKHPNCECNITKFDYIRKQYKNGTLHLMRKCPQCGKIAQNAMRQDEYDVNWVDTLPIISTDGRSEPAKSTESRRPAPKPKTRVQSRADAIQAKLSRHIESRTL